MPASVAAIHGALPFHLSRQVVADRLQVDQTAASLRTGFSQANRFDLAAIDELVGEATFQPEQPLNVREPSELRKYRAATTGRNRCHGGFRARGARWCRLVVHRVPLPLVIAGAPPIVGR